MVAVIQWGSVGHWKGRDLQAGSKVAPAVPIAGPSYKHVRVQMLVNTRSAHEYDFVARVVEYDEESLISTHEQNRNDESNLD